MAKVEATISEDLKARWSSFCKAQERSSAAMIKLLMQRVLESNSPGESKKHRIGKTKDNKMLLEFNDDDFAEISKRAEQGGFSSRPSWVKHLVYLEIDQEPLVNQKEIAALRESNRQLRSVGTNLNQIAHALNIDFRGGNKVTIELIESLMKEIELHTDAVTDLVHRSMNRRG
jgi:hypothetical protein